MCVFTPMTNSALIRVSQLPGSPNPLPPHSRKKTIFIFHVLDLLQTPLILSIPPALKQSCSIFAQNAVLLKVLQSIFIVSLLAVLIEN